MGKSKFFEFIMRTAFLLFSIWIVGSFVTNWILWNDHIARRESCSESCYPLEPRMIYVDTHITDGETCFCETSRGFLRKP